MIDLFLIYKFLRKLSTPFEEWQAFKLGIIDKDGNILIHSKDFKTMDQRDAFSKLDLMILNLKKLIAKVPGGSTKIATMAAVLYLLKEDHDSQSVDEKLFETYILEVEGSGVPTTNTSNIPDTVAKKSPVFRRKDKDLLK